MNETLKPCPFCGGVGYLDSIIDLETTAREYVIVCGACTAQARWATTKADAIDAWNMRAVEGGAA